MGKITDVLKGLDEILNCPNMLARMFMVEELQKRIKLAKSKPRRKGGRPASAYQNVEKILKALEKHGSKRVSLQRLIQLVANDTGMTEANLERNYKAYFQWAKCKKGMQKPPP